MFTEFSAIGYDPSRGAYAGSNIAYADDLSSDRNCRITYVVNNPFELGLFRAQNRSTINHQCCHISQVESCATRAIYFRRLEMSLAAEVLTKYFDAQKELVAIQSIDDRNVILSLPLHVSAYSRIELSITQISKSVFVVSDMGQTLGEMTDAGYQISDNTRKRIHELVEMAKIQLDGKTLFRQCNANELGKVIHEFADTAKTVGDAYLAFPSRGGSGWRQGEQ